MSSNVNLLTSVIHDHTAENRALETWTTEDYLTSARQLLARTTSNTAEALIIVKAAGVLVEAAKAAGRTPLPVKTAPARVRRDGDVI